MNRTILALLLAATTVAGLPAMARAQDRTGAGAAPKTETAVKPDADTHEPGKTATDAVTNPATVPPTEGAVGTGKPPATEPPSAPGR